MTKIVGESPATSGGRCAMTGVGGKAQRCANGAALDDIYCGIHRRMVTRWTHWTKNDPKKDARDARIRKAAPQLLEALRALLAAVEADAFQHFEGQGLGPVEEQARAAIRLVEGDNA